MSQCMTFESEQRKINWENRERKKVVRALLPV